MFFTAWFNLIIQREFCTRGSWIMWAVNLAPHTETSLINTASVIVKCSVVVHSNQTELVIHPHLHSALGMGTETRYLIGLGAKLWKTGVSISSDVNGSAIGTGEIKKTHIHLLLLYIHSILQILSHQSRLLFLYRFILKHLSMMHFCYSQFRSEIALTRRSFSARNMKAV